MRVPVKTPVERRTLLELQSVREEKNRLALDPLLKLNEAIPLLGSPSYTTIRGWIKSGSLHVWRPGQNGHFKIRLSEVKRFLADNEVRNVQS